MRRQYLLIVTGLLVSMFIYLFYRPEATVINKLFISIFSHDVYLNLKTGIQQKMALQDWMVFSMPEGLWIFCITLASKSFYIRIQKIRVNCELIPLIYALGLEIIQYLGFVPGTFDLSDIVFSVFFWLMAYIFFNTREENRNLFKTLSYRSMVIYSSYSIVYLSHVWY